MTQWLESVSWVKGFALFTAVWVAYVYVAAIYL